MFTYTGSIEQVLATGEYDQGDMALISYDELLDLVEQAKLFKALWTRERLAVSLGGDQDAAVAEGIAYVERRANRPLHPVLGGKSPYTEFLPL